MAYATLNDKNLKFLSGPQANIESLISAGGATEGAFYLTYDTHRLYVGHSNGSKVIPVPVNEGIITVASASALPSTVNSAHPGEFYYCTAESILAVCSGLDSTGKPQWLQMNKDHSVANSTDAVEVTKTTNNVTVTTTVTDDNTGAAQRTATGSFSISGGTNVTVDANDNAITIAAADTKYDVEASEKSDAASKKYAEVLFKEGTTTKDTVNIKAGTGLKEVNQSGNDITIVGIDYTVDSAIASAVASSGNGFNIGVSQLGSDVTTVFDPIVKVGSTEYHFVDGKADLSVYLKSETYSKTEVDNKLTALNGMHFEGVATSASSLVTGSEQIGSTWMASQDFPAQLNGKDVFTGDLIVITGGTETSTGVTNPTYTIVPAGNDQTVSCSASVAHGIEILGSRLAGEDAAVLGKLELDAGSLISLSDTFSNDNKNNKVTIAHATVSHTTTADTAVSQSAGSDATYVAISDITTDDYGHITAIKTKTLTAKDTHDSIESIAYAAAAVTGGVSVTETINQLYKGDSSGSFSMVSDTLDITADSSTTSKVHVELNWGSF